MEDNWTQQYWKYMIAENFEEAIPLKLDNFPTSFFKYRHLKDLTIDTIDQNYIWLAEISTLNDPFECSLHFDNDDCLRKYYGSTKFQNFFKKLAGNKLTTHEIKKLTTSQKPFLEYKSICRDRNIPLNLSPEQQLDKVQNRWADIVSDMNKNLRICSFSLTKSSLLLWAHYASEHKGIAIEYDFIDFDTIRSFIQPVVYSDKVHKIGIFEEYTTMQLIGSSLIKSKDWEYEKEWRLTIFKQRDNFSQKMTVPNPIGIYLGTRFDSNEKSLKDKLYNLANARGIPIYRMSKHPNEFKLVSTKYI
jgi:hypothetical protein